MASPLIRAALMVANLAVARRFYGDLFGLDSCFFEGDLTATPAWRLLGMAEGRSLRAVILKPRAIGNSPAPDFGMIGLFEAEAGALPVGPAPRLDGVRLGEIVLVFYHPDLDAAGAKAEALGGTVIHTPTRFSLRSPGNREMMLRCPDGYALNVIERDPERAWRI